MRRDVVRHLQGAYGVGERRACSATGFRRSSHRYRSRQAPQVELRMWLRDLAASRVRYGYRSLHVSLRREGWATLVRQEARGRLRLLLPPGTVLAMSTTPFPAPRVASRCPS